MNHAYRVCSIDHKHSVILKHAEEKVKVCTELNCMTERSKSPPQGVRYVCVTWCKIHGLAE